LVSVRTVLAGLVILLIVVAGLLILLRPREEVAPPAPLVWASTQLAPAAEQAFVRELLKDFTGETGIEVEFVPLGYAEMASKIEAEVTAGRVATNLIGALSTEIEFFVARGWVEDLRKFGALGGRTFFESVERASIIRDSKAYVPWIIGTYVMVINNKAFDYLPPGLTKEDVIMGSEKWTYDALLEWAKRVADATGKNLVGFPAAPGGLFHRFLHGYLYPSFTGYQAKEFNSLDATRAWEYLRELWKYVNPASTTWDAMAEPLLKEEVWIAWDHIARIRAAITTKPDDFTVAPVPAGPKGRGYIIVLGGLAIPKGAPNQDEAWKLVEFLTRPEVQAKVAEAVGWLPTTMEAEVRVTGPVGKIVEGSSRLLATKDGIPVFIPPLGGKGGEFSSTYREAFERIVLRNEDTRIVLDELMGRLKEIFESVGVPLS
jgi:carbohydrate ABC transporter substrate-binding protein, CUT1 family (TC 3.A.1.1.-)